MTATITQSRSTEYKPIQLETKVCHSVSKEEELIYREVFGDWFSETKPRYKHPIAQEPLDPQARNMQMRREDKLFYLDCT